MLFRSHVTNFRCERWQTPDGKVVTAALPAGIDGHFGPELRRFVLALYHQGQMTVSRLVTLLRGLGIFISKRQLVRLLNTGKDEFLTEARDVHARDVRRVRYATSGFHTWTPDEVQQFEERHQWAPRRAWRSPSSYTPEPTGATW